MAKVNKFSTPDKNKTKTIDEKSVFDFIEKGGSVSKGNEDIEKENAELKEEKIRSKSISNKQVKEKGKSEEIEVDDDDKIKIVNLRIPNKDLKKIDDVVGKVKPKTDRHKWILGLIYREAKIK